jgi:hypothetical protein
MGIYSEEILSACSTFGYSCLLLDAAQAASLHANVQKKFTKSPGQAPLWERLISDASIHDVNGWKYISSFTHNQPVLIFFDARSDNFVVLLDNGSNLTDILGDCTGFVFYVTNQACDYLICFNDHDVLIGVGTAKKWIDDLKVKVRGRTDDESIGYQR